MRKTTSLERFSITCPTTKTEVITSPKQTKENTAKKKKGKLALKPSELPKARENTGDQVVIVLCFASDWLREWREFSGPITERSKAKPIQSGITFDTHPKTTPKTDEQTTGNGLNSTILMLIPEWDKQMLEERSTGPEIMSNLCLLTGFFRHVWLDPLLLEPI